MAWALIMNEVMIDITIASTVSRLGSLYSGMGCNVRDELTRVNKDMRG